MTDRSSARVFGVVPHLKRPQAIALASSLIADLTARGCEVRVPRSDAEATGLMEWAHEDEGFAEGLELAFSLGGDGTMLRTVDLLNGSGVPVLGVNVGHLGYLTTLLPAELPDRLDQLLAGEFVVEERMMLRISLYPRGHTHDRAHPVDSLPDASPSARTMYALNDAVLEKSSAGTTVRLGVWFNGEPFIDYSTDGLIIATPTGSTAYAFSARGPIVSPLMQAIVVVPVSPHMLFDRSLVLAGSETVRIEVLDGRNATLFVDGRSAGSFEEGSSIVCERNTAPARLVAFGERDFHAILKAKFRLAGIGMPERERYATHETGVPGAG
jgi:NAD+ kinase